MPVFTCQKTRSCLQIGLMRIRHSSYEFATQSSHSVDQSGCQAKIASIEIDLLRIIPQSRISGLPDQSTSLIQELSGRVF